MTYRDPMAGRPALSPMFLRASVGAIDSLAGPFITPHITPKRLQGLLAYAPQAQGETVLAVVDDTVMSSAKTGLTLTDRAVYFSQPRARVPVEAIVQVPTFARGMREPGVLETSLGALTLPVLIDEGVTAMNKLLRAVAFFNRGGFRVPYAGAPFFGPVAELAARTLAHPEVPVVPTVPLRAVHAASNVAGLWLDHDHDEELLAFLDDTAGSAGDRFIALTDRRLVARIDDAPMEVPYRALGGATLKTGLLTNTIVLQTAFGERSVSTIASAAASRAVTDFLASLCALPPEHRRSLPVAPASSDDPSGAIASYRSLACPDLRAATLLELVHRSLSAGAMPVDAATDLVARTMRMQRTLRGGHGVTEAFSRTPLSAGDFEAVLSTVFGPPVRQGMIDARTGMLEYELGRSGSGAGTIASNVIGLTLLAVVGVGWISTGSSGPQRVHMRLMDAPGGAGFLLSDSAGSPLAHNNAKLAGGLLEAVAELSAQVLLRRALFGWNARPAQLLAEPVASVDARARALMPEVDLAPFLP